MHLLGLLWRAALLLAMQGAATQGAGCHVASLAEGSSTDHVCAVLADGSLRCWGTNANYECGLDYGDGAARVNVGDAPGEMGAQLPAVDLGTGRTALQVAAGYFHTCVLLDNGKLRCFGWNFVGQLGLGLGAGPIGGAPSQMGDKLPYVNLGTGRTVRQVVAGNEHTCAVLDDYSVKCWGRGDSGQLGLGDSQNRGAAPTGMGDTLPVVNLGTGRTARQVVAGDDHTCALLDTGDVRCWGDNNYGQLGLGSSASYVGNAPGAMGDKLPTVKLGTNRTAKQLVAGGSHVCALLDDGSLRCWGSGAYGQLGVGSTDNIGSDPIEMGDNLQAVDLGTGRTALHVTAGGSHTCALLNDYSVRCWGNATFGQLGVGGTAAVGISPAQMGDQLKPVDLGTGRTARQVVAGFAHTCALLDDKTVKCWGDNEHGQLGQGNSAGVGGKPGSVAALRAVQLCAASTPASPSAPPPPLPAPEPRAAAQPPPQAPPFKPPSMSPPAASLPPSPAVPPLPPGSQPPEAPAATSSTSSSGGLKGGVIAGIVVAIAAVSIVGLVLAIVLIRKRRPARSTLAGGDQATSAAKSDASDSLVASSLGGCYLQVMETQHYDMQRPPAPAQQLPHGQTPASGPAIAGLSEGDVFACRTAADYAWAPCSTANDLTPVEAGVNDIQLDRMKRSRAGGQPFCPVIQLSKEELREQVTLLTTGLLGRGGSALVFRGLWPARFGPNAMLAVKVLTDGDHPELGCLRSFCYEAAVLTSVRHPNVVRIYGYCLELPTMCIILELLPYSLKQLLYEPQFTAGYESACTSLQSSNQVSVGTRTSAAQRLTSSTTATNEKPFASAVSQALSEEHTSVAMQPTLGGLSHAAVPATATAPSGTTIHHELTMLDVVKLSTQVAAGLAYLHNANKHTAGLPASLSRHLQAGEGSGGASSRVVHRDMKPANILINSQGTAKISDFGLARQHDDTTVHTDHGGAGTIAYMAPELLGSQLPPTNKVDVYSLAVVMWEMLAHQPPWKGTPSHVILAAVVAGHRPILPATAPAPRHACEVARQPASLHALPQLNAIIRQCWEGREHKRPQAQEVHMLLLQLLEQLQSQ